MICFYRTSFLSLEQVVVQGVVAAAVCLGDGRMDGCTRGFCGPPRPPQERNRTLVVLLTKNKELHSGSDGGNTDRMFPK